MAEEQSPISLNPKQAKIGLSLDATTSDIPQGMLSYALNAVKANFDGQQVTYQNETGNVLCTNFPEGYTVVHTKNIIEKDLIVVFLVKDDESTSEIGVVDTNTCIYTPKINSPCIGFSKNTPILKSIYKVTNCTTELYWANPERRYIDLENLPFKEEVIEGQCEREITDEVDCNKMRVQPDFLIPQIEITDVDSDGELVAGTYQFTVQYANLLGEAYTAFYSVTNPLPIFDPNKVTQDFNYTVGKSINVNITNIDQTGFYDYFNLAVVKTVNNISSVELVGTYKITTSEQLITYTGQNQTQIKLTVDDVFAKYPIYDGAGDIFSVQDVLGWDDLTTTERLNYQEIANAIKPKWQTWRLMNNKPYSDELNAANIRGYMRDEVVPFSVVFELDNGYQTDAFPLTNRVANATDLEMVFNDDVVDGGLEICDDVEPKPRWQVYNTGTNEGLIPQFCPDIPDFTLTGTISHICKDVGCTEQGGPILYFTFDKPTPEQFTLKIAHTLLLLGSPTPPTTLYAMGYEIYPLPPTPTWSPNPQYFPNPEKPFEITIPQGVTSFVVDQLIYHPPSVPPRAWVCHSCLFPINHWYIKPVSTSGYLRLQMISLDPGVPMTNVPMDNPIDPPPPPPGCMVYDPCYEGPWERGDFAYWESTERYPCTPEIWGELADKPIRHFKFPDNLVTNIHDENFIYPIGIEIDMQQVIDAIKNSSLTQEQKDRIQSIKIVRGNAANNKSVVAKGLINNVGVYNREGLTFYMPNYPYNDLRADPFLGYTLTSPDDGDTYLKKLEAYTLDDSKQRFTFHSPDTSFYQPGLGNILKLETAEYGTSQGHFQSVQEHARYKFLTKDAYATAVAVAQALGFVSSKPGSLNFFSGEAAMAGFQVMIDILYKSIPRKNYTYQYNSIGNYTNYVGVQNDQGTKQRRMDIGAYAAPGVISLSDNHPINNFQRESSVYIRTTKTLPFPSDIGGVPQDTSRWTLGEEGLCDNFNTILEKPISSYYASIKTNFVNQYGQINSYELVDTGFTQLIDLDTPITDRFKTIFGGDTFITKFAYKSKLPFFIDNRVNADDESDIFYDEIGNAAYPLYWFSTDAQSYGSGGGVFNNLEKMFGVKVNNFDCRADKFFYQNGKIYLFAYGIPYFWCESRVNTDLRQAYNDKEGDFFPHVDEFIPDYWLQEKNVSIQNDNTYWYNKSFSKQNKENYFSRLPDDYRLEECTTHLQHRAIYSEKQEDIVNYRRNNWLVYRPASKFDFPQNFGRLVSLDGIENKAVLARFESKALLYNTLLTINTSNPQAAYLGNDTLFKSSPPIDYAETDMGFIGSEHKFLLKTEYGHITGDSKRGQMFLLQGTSGKEITGNNVNKFFSEHLPFQIKKAFPEVNIDQNYNGIGLHGVYDAMYNRLILTKLDYKPLISGITYEDNKFYYNGDEIALTNREYFCNHSFTISYDFDSNNWISLHTYLPNYYIGNNNTFYAGLPNSIWAHNNTFSLFNNFFGEIAPYILEYPYYFQGSSEILQNIKDYTRVLEYTNERTYIQTDDTYFNKAILYTPQQCSGLLLLTQKPANNLALYKTYPKYNADSKEILYTKSSSFYQFNTFWGLVEDKRQPLFISSCESLSIYKELNQSNMSYSKRSYRKEPLRGKELKVRLILDDRSDSKFISQFTLATSMKSIK